MHSKKNPYEPYMKHGKPENTAGNDDRLPPFNPSAAGPTGGLFPEAEPAPEAPDAEKNVPELSDEELYALCLPRLCVDCPQKKEADNARLRALAELDNAQKRLKREKEESVRFAAENVLADLLPSLDNLDLALQHASASDACKSFVTGVDMTLKLLLETLKRHGLEKIGAVGEPFDPARHEAVGMADVAEVPDGAVCALLSPGYLLSNRLLRPARVTVCRKS